MRLAVDQNPVGSAVLDQLLHDPPHLRRVLARASGELAVAPSARAALSVAQVGLGVQDAPVQQLSDGATPCLHRLATLCEMQNSRRISCARTTAFTCKQLPMIVGLTPALTKANAENKPAKLKEEIGCELEEIVCIYCVFTCWSCSDDHNL